MVWTLVLLREVLTVAAGEEGEVSPRAQCKHFPHGLLRQLCLLGMCTAKLHLQNRLAGFSVLGKPCIIRLMSSRLQSEVVFEIYRYSSLLG